MKMNKFLFLFIFSISIITVYSMEENYNFKNIISIRHKCYSILEQLDKQPEMTHYRCMPGVKRCKALPIDYRLARVIEIVCDAVQEKIGPERAWHVESVGCGTQQITLPNGSWMGDGVVKKLYNNYQPTECSLRTLKREIKTVMENITINWQRPTISSINDINCIYIKYAKIKDKSSILIKKQIIKQEELLFRFLLALLNFHNFYSHNRWKNNYDEKVLYLVITKNSFDKIVKKLKLQISEGDFIID